MSGVTYHPSTGSATLGRATHKAGGLQTRASLASDPKAPGPSPPEYASPSASPSPPLNTSVTLNVPETSQRSSAKPELPPWLVGRGELNSACRALPGARPSHDRVRTLGEP